MQTCSAWSEDVRVVLGLASHYLFIFLFSLFFFCFPGPISIRIDTLWTQLVLEFSVDQFETTSMHICSTWSEDVCVVWI